MSAGRSAVVVIAFAALAALPAAAGASGFSLGVTAGEVTSSSALVWTRSDTTGTVKLQVARDRRFHHVVAETKVKATLGSDRTVQVTVRRLTSDSTFYYRFLRGSHTSDTGTFRTAPSAKQNATIRFAWTGDEDAQRAPGQSRPFYNNFEVFGAMARERNAFNLNVGDTIYSDTEVGANGKVSVGPGPKAADPALTVSAKWAKYRQNLALSNYQRVRRAAGLYSHWDDHEFLNDFSRSETLTAYNAAGIQVSASGASLYAPGVKAFRDYNPVTYSSRNGIYRSFRWGKNLEVFMLDERSFRSAKASTNGTCNNPQTGAPDLAPTGPQATRNVFSVLVPSLSQPVSQACLNAINDPTRTMLGQRQFTTFTRAIRRSNATFKVIVNEVPVQQFYVAPYDRWEGYEFERKRLLTFLRSNVKNTIFLTTDDHANLINDARLNTFPSEGGPTNSGITDVTTGPVATADFKREINGATGQDPDTGANAGLVDSIFFTNQPTATPIPGVGMRCSVISTFSYGEVTVTSKQLRVQLKDASRRPVREEEGTKPACPAVVLNKR
jgi:alkaline phosphatase D